MVRKIQESSGKFCPGIAFTINFVQFGSIYWKTAAKAWNWYQRWLWRNRTRISVKNIPSGKTRLPFLMFPCSRKYSAKTTQRVDRDPFTFQQDFPETFCVNGKQPTYIARLKVWSIACRTKASDSTVIPKNLLGHWKGYKKLAHF